MRYVPQDQNGYAPSLYEKVGQWENWKNLLDMANAIRYGFSHYRLPKPGQSIAVDETRARIERIDQGWAVEHRNRGNEGEKPNPNFSGLPIEAQCYLHSILESAKGEPESNVGNDWSLYG